MQSVGLFGVKGMHAPRKTLLVSAVLLVLTCSAAAQRFSLIHTFSITSEGSSPHAGLTADSAGNLFGTTYDGGTFDFGTVYELPAKGGEKVLHNFTGGVDGAYPTGGVILDPAGNIYGSTKVGGDPSCGDIGCGVIFKLSPQGGETVLYVFKGQGDGGVPVAGLIRDVAGNLYGTAAEGGILTGFCGAGLLGCGVVFKLDPSGHETVLHAFTGIPDGATPAAPLVRDPAGNLYGTTELGGSTGCNTYGCGVVFRVDPKGNEDVLHTFNGGTDGGEPLAGLALDSSGNLYGTTSAGGDLSSGNGGCGVVFRVSPAGTTVLYTFRGAADGRIPYAGLVLDTEGNLYGTTSLGGDIKSSCGTLGCGVVFKLDPSGKETILHSFHGTDGELPYGGLLLRNGYLYGTTLGGGGSGSFDFGVAFKILLPGAGHMLGND